MKEEKKYFSVVDFERLQHYKKRNPPWVKLYYDLLDDDDFTQLRDDLKWAVVGCLLLACRSSNKILADVSFVRKKLFMRRLDLNELLNLKWFTTFVASKQQASVLAERKLFAMPETETETETEKKNKTPLALKRADVVKEPRYSEAFELFWKASTRRGSKQEANRVWRQLKPSAELQVSIRVGMESWQHSEQWQDETKQPHIFRWLKRRGWEEIVPNSTRRVAAGGAGGAETPTTLELGGTEILDLRARQRQRLIEQWDEDYARHRHSESCQHGKVCSYVPEKRPKSWIETVND